MSSVSGNRAGGWVYDSGDPKGTLTCNSFLRGVREEGSKVEVVRSGRRLDWGGVRADRMRSESTSRWSFVSAQC
jgi:hypothetical protein